MKGLTVKNVSTSQGQKIARDGNEFTVKKIIPDEEVFLHYHLYYLLKCVWRDRPVESTCHQCGYHGCTSHQCIKNKASFLKF